MNAREFFYLVSQMRQAQRDYFQTREQYILKVCKMYEKQVDDEIARTKAMIQRETDEELAKVREILSRKDEDEEPGQ